MEQTSLGDLGSDGARLSLYTWVSSMEWCLVILLLKAHCGRKDDDGKEEG